MRQVRHRHGAAVAFIAALVLVLQSFLSAWAAGAYAATPMLDAFGNPLCIIGVDHDAPAGDRSRMPDCCVFGCNMASPLPAAASGDGIGLLRPLSSDDIRFDRIEGFQIQSPDHDPGSPRAPPVTA